MAIRTNNDIEGWHNALNRRASGQCGLSLYSLIELLDRGKTHSRHHQACVR